MRINTKIKRAVVGGVILSVALIGSGITFVTYFMHSVYEEEEPILELSGVPEPVLDRFTGMYPQATNIYWQLEDGAFEAECVQLNGTETEVVFLPNGALDRVVTRINLTDLPEKARSYLQKQTQYNIIEPEKIVRGAVVEYEVKLVNSLMEWNCLFNADGHFLSRERDGPILE